jgi:radical SAM protein with 4Fe4S-binding SPASM domain
MQDVLTILQTLRKMRRAYKSGAKKLDYLPLRLWVELTNNCNLRCTFCPNSKPQKDEKGFMSLDTFKETVNQAKHFAYDINLSHRGESLLNDQLSTMIAYAKANGLSTRLNTNATILDEEKAAEIIGAGLDFISFSFDGIVPEIYESTRKNANYQTTLDNILKFLKIKKIMKSYLPYVMLEVLEIPNISLDKENLNRFRALFKRLPLNKFTVKPLHNWGGQLPVDKSAGRSSPIGTKYSPCTNIWYSMVILWDGSVALCCQDWYNENCLGNIKDSSLEAMWNGETIVAVRDLLAKKQFNQIETCSKCDLLWRPSYKGVPNVNLINFLTENIIGYNRLRSFFSPVEKFLESRDGVSSRKIIE